METQLLSNRAVPRSPTTILAKATRLAAALCFFTSAGCAASAQFYSKTGQTFPEIAERAVICDESEADILARAGAQVIGTIAAQANVVTATDDDLTQKAAVTAARSGGTHVVLTSRGVATFDQYHPETRDRRCTTSEYTTDCRTVVNPASVTTTEVPTAKYVVFRAGPELWASLPPNLRPMVKR